MAEKLDVIELERKLKKEQKELWQRLPQAVGSCRMESIMISDYPSVVEEWTNDQIESDMKIVLEAVTKIRSLRPATDKNEKRAALALCRAPQARDLINSYEFLITTLASLSSVKILNEGDAVPAGCAIGVVNEHLSVYLELQGALNAEAEREKLRKKKDELQKQKTNLEQKMEASGYKEKAPASVQEEDMKKLTSLMEELNIVIEAERRI